MERHQHQRDTAPRKPHNRRTWRIVAAAGLVAAAGMLLARRSGEPPASAGGPEAVAVATIGVLPACGAGRSYFVAPDGDASSTASRDDPIDLTTALSEKTPAKPCDTIWLRGGTYAGTFTSTISGTERAPIVVRQLPGERAILDSAPSKDPALTVRGNHVWIWGIEITSSDPNRTSAEPSAWPGDLRRGTGIVLAGRNTKVINCHIHDLARGIEVAANAVAPELYGNVIHGNGWDGPETSNGNGIETHNEGPRQTIANNIVFNQYSHGILALSSDTFRVDNLTLEGNVVFNNGLPGRAGFARDILVGGGQPALNPILRDNQTYGGAQTFVGYAAGCQNATITRNYLVGSTPLLLEKCDGTVVGNTLFGQYDPGWLQEAFPENTYRTSRPTGVVIRQRPNAYEPGRIILTVYNWEKHGSVSVDVSPAGLETGDQYEIRDAQNFQGPPLVSGTFTGDPVEIPMSSLAPAPLVGARRPVPHTAPEFGVFVLSKLASTKHTLAR